MATTTGGGEAARIADAATGRVATIPIETADEHVGWHAQWQATGVAWWLGRGHALRWAHPTCHPRRLDLRVHWGRRTSSARPSPQGCHSERARNLRSLANRRRFFMLRMTGRGGLPKNLATPLQSHALRCLLNHASNISSCEIPAVLRRHCHRERQKSGTLSGEGSHASECGSWSGLGDLDRFGRTGDGSFAARRPSQGAAANNPASSASGNSQSSQRAARWRRSCRPTSC